MAETDMLKRLRSAHQAIFESLDAVGKMRRDYEHAKPLVQQLENLLAAYFGSQSDVFDALTEKFSASREKIKLLEFFADDLKSVKVKVFTFFDSYSGNPGGAPKRNFSTDFQSFAQEISARLQLEEKYLFSFFE